MCVDQRLTVLKFGGSVLQSPDDLEHATREVYRWRRNGYQVVAVVSAVGDTTDQLCRQAGRFGEVNDEQKTALLLATGELQSAALLGLALDRAGVSCVTGDDVGVGLVTAGPPLDARPVDLDTRRLQQQLDQYGVVVIPGFIGRDRSSGQVCLLGRGGSDLTALFVASRMSADACRLIKDVSGLFEFDPKSGGPQPRRFAEIRHADALQLDESIVQHKGIRFARDHHLQFEVGSLYASSATRVGNFPTSRFAGRPGVLPRLRISLIGLGTVGWGVYQTLRDALSERFEVVRVAVRDRDKALAAGADPDRLTTDVCSAIDAPVDVVVELAGGQELPGQWIDRALKQGKHVVTANKAVLARAGGRLQALADWHGVSLCGSAAVGGAAEMLESVDNALATGHRITSLTGVLNGSTNHILDRVRQGMGLAEALDQACEAGYTEADPARDLEGIDAAEKLVLIVRRCGYELAVEDVERQALTVASVADQVSGRRFRQVARWTVQSGRSTARVGIESVDEGSLLAATRGAGNVLQLTTDRGDVRVVRGLGAGRWPTTQSVVADLIDLELQRRQQSTETTNRDRAVSASA